MPVTTHGLLLVVSIAGISVIAAAVRAEDASGPNEHVACRRRRARRHGLWPDR